jgi:phosphomannomutase
VFGAMEGGGFCYGRHLPECDGILSGLFFAEMVAMAEKPLREILHQIHNAVGQVHYNSIDINCEMVSAMNMLTAIARFPPKPFADINVQDMQRYEQDGAISGMKFILGECRWLLIQSLASESIIRLHAEGESEEDVTMILAMGKRCFEL